MRFGEVKATYLAFFRIKFGVCKAVVMKVGGASLFLDLHGMELLLSAEILNRGLAWPRLSMAIEVTPCCGTACAAASSTSRPACHQGGPSTTPSRRSTSARRQVVSSPTTASMAVNLSASSSSVDRDLIAFSEFFLRSCL